MISMLFIFLTFADNYILINMKYRNSKEFMVDRVDLSILVTELRTLKGMSIRELAAESGVMPYTISNIETTEATPSFFTLSKLFHGMGYTISEAYSLLPSINPPLD